MKDTTSRLLSFAKEFFVSGERELELKNTNMAYMQSVLKFHDAVEYCIRGVIEEFKVNHDRNADLLRLMKCINKDITDRQLPLFSQMDFLNTTRGKIKHHASVPSFEDTQRCRLHAKDFLEQVSRDYLGVDFLSVSRIILVDNPNVRHHLEVATREKKSGNYLEALISIKKAFHAARPSNRTFIDEDSSLSGRSLSSVFRKMPELRQQIEKMANKINDLEEHLALLLMGVNVLKLRRFEAITPHLIFTYGFCKIMWDNSIILTEDIVDEALDYVVDMTLIWQKMGVVASHPNWFDRSWKLWTEIRREKMDQS